MSFTKMIRGEIATRTGRIPIVATSLNGSDLWGTVKARLGLGRMKYKIEPGLYAVGEPNEKAPVFVTANYKMSFDYLRKELSEVDGWILVLDTKGINVWCAAGKGTFGTDELVSRVCKTQLKKIINHHQLILPQLGAVGVSAHRVRELSGFKVIFGPVRAHDIPEFIRLGKKATEKMRTVHFSLLNRLVLTPVEIIHGAKYLLIASVAFFILSGLNSSGISFQLMADLGRLPIVALIAAFMSGTFFTPLFLPLLPTKAFASKGWLMIVPVFLMFQFFPEFLSLTVVEKISWFFMMSAISSFFAMNFTGSSTFTSLSGVKKEMKVAVPLQIVSFAGGFIGWLLKRFI